MRIPDLEMTNISGKYNNDWIVFYWRGDIRRVVASGDTWDMSIWMSRFRSLCE